MKPKLTGKCAVAALMLAQGLASAADDMESIPAIEITGQRSLLQLRQEIARAEDAVYGLWNASNGDSLFDIECVFEAPVGSQIKRKRCAPRFVAEATRDNGIDFLRKTGEISGPHTVATGTPFADIQKYVKRYQQKMQDTILQNPALRTAVLKHQSLLDELDKRSAAGVSARPERD